MKIEISQAKQRPTQFWSLFVDGLASVEITGVGILLISPQEEEKFDKAIKFKFSASNNQAEYQALIAGIELAQAIAVDEIVISCVSQLIVKQIQGEYGANHPLLIQYRDMGKKLLQIFKYQELVQINCASNERVDKLSKLASEELENQSEMVQVDFLETLTYERVEIMVIDGEEKDWGDEMKDYIKHDILPADFEQSQ